MSPQTAFHRYLPCSGSIDCPAQQISVGASLRGAQAIHSSPNSKTCKVSGRLWRRCPFAVVLITRHEAGTAAKAGIEVTPPPIAAQLLLPSSRIAGTLSSSDQICARRPLRIIPRTVAQSAFRRRSLALFTLPSTTAATFPELYQLVLSNAGLQQYIDHRHQRVAAHGHGWRRIFWRERRIRS